MPRSRDSKRGATSSELDELEDIEILKNLLELRTSLGREKGSIDLELE